MTKTIDKVLLGVLAILVIGMGAVFITALNSNQEHTNQLFLKEQTYTPSLVAEEDDADETPDVAITGTALEQAGAAALAYIGEGRVTDSEIGDEEGYYEIEITLDNGNEVDVHLDENFKVVGSEWEGEEDED